MPSATEAQFSAEMKRFGEKLNQWLARTALADRTDPAAVIAAMALVMTGLARQMGDITLAQACLDQVMKIPEDSWLQAERDADLEWSAGKVRH